MPSGEKKMDNKLYDQVLIMQAPVDTNNQVNDELKKNYQEETELT